MAGSIAPQSGGRDSDNVGTCAKSVAPVVMVMEPISKAAVPVLANKIVCALLVVPTVRGANVSGVGGVGVITTPGTATAEPVPDSDIDVGLEGALLEKSIVPVAAPTTVGVNVTVNVHEPPGATGGVKKGQVVVKANGPVDVGALRVKLAVPLLVKVTTCAGLVVLMVCGPNTTGEVVNVMAGAAMIVAGTVSVCVGAVTVRPNVVSIAESALMGKVNVPVLPGNPVATTLTEMVQVELGKMVGVGCAVSVICVATVKLTALGHVLLIGDGPTT